MQEKFLKIDKVAITWNQAKCIVGSYNDHPKRLMTTQNGQSVTLHGFTFPKENLMDLFNETGAEKIFIALGHHSNDPAIDDGFTTLIFGLDDGDNLITDDYKIFDYCDPCPKKCPTNIALLAQQRTCNK